ncbi:hypothetical protein A1D22_10380 [Pasteurellaceae bacterium LFhippo2]|nr:hypothetical protein [Pasteurellaceae bacterium LFhippo2]
MMKKLFSVAILALATVACSNEQTANSDENDYGCLTSAGFTYSFLKRACVQPFEKADIRITDSTNSNYAAYVILSDDKQRAELFAVDVPRNTILQAVKGGYISDDDKIRLMKTKKSWKISK